ILGLVNNAGISIPLTLNAFLKKEHFAKILDVNLLGMIEVTLSMLPLVRNAKGQVVNVSSALRELSYFGVKVAIIEPGFFQTTLSSDDWHLSLSKMLSEIKMIYDEKFLLFCEWVFGTKENESRILSLLVVLTAVILGDHSTILHML
ncbi:hypothetical protein U0070_014755, partial [Myodes glareolus]